jgi:two-component system sensor histidine kinase VicK
VTATPQADADQRWRTAVLAIGGLLIAIAVIGVVGILINRTIHQTVDDAIAHDVELADSSGDLRVAILEVRHYHRDLLLNNPDPTRVELWQQRYRTLVAEIATVESVIERHPDRALLPDVTELRSTATAYFDDFASAVQNDIDNPAEFRDVATDLLVPLESMQTAAIAIDRAGEERAAAAFADIEAASNTGTLILLAVMVGLGAMGGVLAVAVLRLVQEQRRLVSVEQAVVAQMAEASRAKTDFIADASHELRTPLTVLRGNAEVGLALNSDCEHAEILTEIVEESARMSRLVDDLLFLARSDASSVPLEIRDVDAQELLQALVGRAEVLARDRGATIGARVAAGGRLRADPGRIEQAVLILVDNAAKYGPDGGVIELEAGLRDGRLAIEVLDRGPGIPAAQLGRIFERFYRVDGAERGRSSGGVGLGLSIAAAIVEGHGGHIVAAAREGGGTRMTVTLPIRGDDLSGSDA